MDEEDGNKDFILCLECHKEIYFFQKLRMVVKILKQFSKEEFKEMGIDYGFIMGNVKDYLTDVDFFQDVSCRDKITDSEEAFKYFDKKYSGMENDVLDFNRKLEKEMLDFLFIIDVFLGKVIHKLKLEDDWVKMLK